MKTNMLVDHRFQVERWARGVRTPEELGAGGRAGAMKSKRRPTAPTESERTSARFNAKRGGERES